MPGMSCPACSGVVFENAYSDLQDYEYEVGPIVNCIVRCRSCGLLLMDPLPGEDELGAFYPESYANVHEEKVALHSYLMDLYYRTVNSLLRSKLGARAKILDVGCASGHLMAYLAERNAGWDIVGIDMSPRACSVAESMGRSVKHGKFESFDFKGLRFDMIIFSHIIEHVLDPAGVLKKAHSLLEAGGMIYIETPNIECLDRKLFGRYWGGLHYPRHICLFSKRSMYYILKSCGFCNVSSGSTYNMFGWALSVQNLLVDKFGFKRKNGRVRLYPFLMIIFLPFVLVQRVFSASCGMRVLAYKK